MPSTIPKQVAAALGLLPSALDAVRRIPGRAVQLPVLAIGSALSGLDAAKREYDELADRGQRLVASLQGGSPNGSAAVQSVAPIDAPSTGRVDSAATAEVIAQVEQVAEELAPEPITEHRDLPLPDYDHLTLGSLRGRLRSLDVAQLVALRNYEKAKGDRLPVVTMLDNRIAKLSSAPGG